MMKLRLQWFGLVLSFIIIGDTNLPAQQANSFSESEDSVQTLTLRGELGVADDLSVKRYFREPFTSLPWLRADLSFEQKRIFTNYSGDISGRFLEIMAVLSKENLGFHPHFVPLMQNVPELQCEDGHFGDPDIDWDGEIDYMASYQEAKYLPTLWGNNRIMCGLIETYKVSGNEKILAAAEKLAGFYEKITKRLTDPKRVAEFTGIRAEDIERHLPGADGKIASTLPVIDTTNAGGYVTCYFPIIEGLVKLYAITGKEKYLHLAERIGEFHQLFDVTTTTHAHGMLCCHYGYLMIYELTNQKKYLDRVEKRWSDMVDGGYVNAMGGTPEGVQLTFSRDEGCANADWLRVNLKLYELTKNTKYLDLAERLMFNQFLINEWSNGGFGHRNIYCDANGMYGFQKHFLECVWCCNYHGTMGFEIFKKYVAGWNDDTLTVNFAVDFELAIKANGTRSTIRSEQIAGDYSFDIQKIAEPLENLILTQKIIPHDTQPFYLSVRIPDWAESVSMVDANGQKMTATEKGGYMISEGKIQADQVVHVQYHGGLVVENRYLKKETLESLRKSESPEATFRYGPYTLVAKGLSRIPYLMLEKNQAGELRINDALQFDALVPLKPGVTKITLEKLSYGSENDTAVFVFNVSEQTPEQTCDYKLGLKNQQNVLTVDLSNGDRDGADITPVASKNDTKQNWLFEDIGAGQVKIINVETGKLISESGNGDAVDGRKVHQWTDVNSPAQFWQKIVVDEKSVKFINKRTGRALTLDSAGSAEAKLVVRADENKPNQIWRLEKIAYRTHALKEVIEK